MLIYIITPYRADNKVQFDKQLKYTKHLCRKMIQKGNDVIAPHLYYPQFLNDDDESERKLGMTSAKNIIKRCDKVLIGVKFGKSEGMLSEIDFANKHNIPMEVTN